MAEGLLDDLLPGPSVIDRSGRMAAYELVPCSRIFARGDGYGLGCDANLGYQGPAQTRLVIAHDHRTPASRIGSWIPPRDSSAICRSARKNQLTLLTSPSSRNAFCAKANAV